MDEYYNSYSYPQVLISFPYYDSYWDQGLDSYYEDAYDYSSWGWPWDFCCKDPCKCHHDPCKCRCQDPCDCCCQDPCDCCCQNPCCC